MKANRKALLPALIVGTSAALLLSGCAADINQSSSSSSATSPLASQNAAASHLIGAHLNFHFSNFYTLENPNPNTACAGDANTFYDPLAMVLPSYSSDYPGYRGTEGPTGPLKLAENIANPGSTISPLFIKNVSVNLTNANAPGPFNLSKTCSMGAGFGSPTVSSCSTFDFGSVGGLPTNMGGSLLQIGGLTSINYTGVFSTQTSGHAMSCGLATESTSSSSGTQNTCTSRMTGLGLNTLPSTAAGTQYAPGISSATGPISAWSDISGQTGYSGPAGAVGAVAAYDSTLQQFVLFSGAAPLTGLTSSITPGPANYDTWVFSIQNQSWSKVNTTANIDISIQRLYDCSYPYGSVCAAYLQLSKPPLGRALFGYVAVQGMALSKLTTGTDVNIGMINNYKDLIDTTDRIVTIGGLGPCGGGYCTDSKSFNPTWGPEYREVDNGTNTLVSINTAVNPSQWIDSSADQLMSNSFNTIVSGTNTEGIINATNGNSNLLSTKFPAPNPTATPLTATVGGGNTFGSTATSGLPPLPGAINFGAVALANNSAASIGLGPSGTYSVGTVVTPGAGYIAAGGGFYGYIAQLAGEQNKTDMTCTNITQCGGDLQVALRRGSLVTLASERRAPNFMFLGNQIDNYGTQVAPVSWSHVLDSSFAATQGTPFFGGGSMVKGLNITSAASNEVVFFGGSDCRDYLTGNSSCTGTVPTNPGRYWTFGTDPGVTALSGAPSLTTMGGSIPTNAGMATARGQDPNGNPIVVAWGGMSARNTSGQTSADTSGTIYYLYKNTGTNLPTWGSYTVPAGTRPPGLGNATMVYSHVTGNFYLFGGYNPLLTSGNQINGTSADTWELSISSTTSSCGSATSATCEFTWRLMDTSSGLSCYPACPSARRSHRMVEANYHYFNSPSEPSCTDPSQPCSFGIFMSGGTSDGLTYLNERWMFDPTANAGNGHWQNVGEFPPRVLSSMVSAQYFVPASNGYAHRALLFGGETGMEDPLAASSGEYFVPPTLGDTWMFDFANNSWNRVYLYGKRYQTAYTANSLMTQAQAREASLTTDSSTALLAPPPLAGATMVTRTNLKKNHVQVGAATLLNIPEIYLFGGRTKDGIIQPLSYVYKFCSGSSGEKPYPNTFIGVSNTVTSPDDATCDGYIQSTNANSPNPNSGYTGRWLYKTPPNPTQDSLTNLDPSTVGAYLSAGAYDSTRDLVLLYGGIDSPGVAVTKPSSFTADSEGTIYEYAPSTSNDLTVSGVTALSGVRSGYWKAVHACQESSSTPAGRYGHNMAFDPVTQSVLVSGGYQLPGNSNNGQLSTQLYSNGSTVTPEVWNAVRFDSANSSGIVAQGIPPITHGDTNGIFPCYYWNQVKQFANDPSSTNPPPGSGVAHAASVYIPSSGFNTGYYTMLNASCVGAGPIATTDPTQNSLLVGSAYFDIDRTQLGANENLLLNLTFLPLGPNNQGPDQNFMTSNDSAIFQVNLIRTGQNAASLQSIVQPRDLSFANSNLYPQVAQKISVVAPPNGQIRQEQILIPLGIDPSIDRVTVGRYSGSGILIDATLMRMGK